MDYSPPSSTLTLPSGRVLGWASYGEPKSIHTIFYMHGFPGSRIEGSQIPTGLLHELDARVIAIDRPGMGLSTHDAGRRLLDWPNDVLAVADHLGVEKFYVMAASGGVPYALACLRAWSSGEIGESGASSMGAKISQPDSTTQQHDSSKDSGSPSPAQDSSTEQPAPSQRLLGAALVCGLYPTSLGTDGMLAGLRRLLLLGSYLPRFVTSFFLSLQLGRSARNPDLSVLGSHFDKEMAGRPDFEKSVLKEPGIRDICVESMREALVQGDDGVATDLMLYGDWGFELDEIKVNSKDVKVWHGRLDCNAPLQMAEKAAKIIGADLRVVEEGHTGTPVRHMEKILRELVGVSGGEDEESVGKDDE